MQAYMIGQRWVNTAEPDLGIGMILEIEHRTVTVIFPATGDTRVYAKQSAPLSRVEFKQDDEIKDQQGKVYKVLECEEKNGIYTYHCKTDNGEIESLPEGKLDHFLQLNQPVERLLNGQVDQNKYYRLRVDSQKHLFDIATSQIPGLTGCRTSLLAHQLYIANEVGKRFAPRVLLADEVGLGKTIEAGLIIHNQLLTERARRILIVLPESLVHQWLVEMLRRFNLHFKVFNEARCEAILNSEDEALLGLENPFETEQLIICSLSFLRDHPERFKQVTRSAWDLLVVDEAHHLEWSEDKPSEEYQLIETLAEQIKGVLLLTATPEQLGKASHFARLRLLDSGRFPSLNQFIEEEKYYQPIAESIETLLTVKQLTPAIKQQLIELEIIQEADEDEPLNDEVIDEWVSQLLDRHGTGRLLFRNTRNAIAGFPKRLLKSHALSFPDVYRSLCEKFTTEFANGEPFDLQVLLSPEIIFRALFQDTSSSWTDIDTRVHWLGEFLQQNKNEKILVIASSQQTALDLASGIKSQTGIHAAVFHEGMSLLERDKAAAYFADFEMGSQVLICSEIGSEGRNFQFAHQMVLFDLPFNPDLLEQRIGRLDRIGQDQDIKIHVPFLKGSAQEVMKEWFHHGINAFELTCPAGHHVFKQVLSELKQVLIQPQQPIEALIAQSKKIYQEKMEDIQNGRDRLLEYNSCRPKPAQQLFDLALQSESHLTIESYMENMYDCLGINSDIKGDKSWLLNASEHMMMKVPGFMEEGMTVTYHRETALNNEDIHYLTWDHPMVRTCIDMVVSSEMGNTALTALKVPSFDAGKIILEAYFIADLPNDEKTQAHRYMPPTNVRLLMDEFGRQIEEHIPSSYIEKNQQNVDIPTAQKVIQARESVIRKILKDCEQVAKRSISAITAQAHEKSKKLIQQEIDRLNYLQHVNGNVRDEEIEFFSQQLLAVDKLIDQADVRLDAVKVIVTL